MSGSLHEGMNPEDGLGLYAAAQRETDRAKAEAAAEAASGGPEGAEAGGAGGAGVGGAGAEAAGAGAAGGEAAGADAGAEGQGEAELSAADLAAAQEARIAQLTEDLARAGANYYNLEQEYAAYVRRTKSEIPGFRAAGISEVVSSLLSVLDDIELARQHGDLSGPFASVAEKLENTLETKFGVRRFGQVGQAFDPALHQAIQYHEGAGQGDTVITQLAQPGYFHGDKILRPAIVVAGEGTVTVAAAGPQGADGGPQGPADGSAGGSAGPGSAGPGSATAAPGGEASEGASR